MKVLGWPITGLVTVFIWFFLALFFALSTWNSETILVAIRANGRISLLLFSLAFLAGA